MDRRSPDHDIRDKIQDIVELINILNKLTNNEYNNDYSKEYLISMVEDMDLNKRNYNQYKFGNFGKNNKRLNTRQYNDFYKKKSENFIDKIIFFLKSLNE